MRNTKRRLETFSFFDHTGIARHLTKMAEKGWLIEKMSNFGWVYRRIEPKKLTFSVCFYPKASEFDPEPTPEQKEFHDFCEYAGWTLAATSAQMQVFYSERENPIPIETDPMLEVRTIHAAAKRSYLPSWFVLLLMSLLGGASFVSTLLGDFIGLLASAIRLFSGVGWFLLFIVCAVEVCGYLSWHKKAVKAAERGEFLETRSHPRLQMTIFAIVMLGFAYYLVTTILLSTPLMRAVALLMVAYTTVLILVVNGTKEQLKRWKAPRGVNRTVTLLVDFILAFALTGAITYGVLRASRSGFFDRGQETYEYNGATFTVYHDELPLTVEDLLDVHYDGYIKEHRSEESLLLGQFVVRQHPRFDAEHYKEMPHLEYTITEVRLPFLYEFCKNSLLNERKDEIENGQVVFADHYEPVDPAPWQANEAYQLYWSSGYLDKYLLCYESRIIELSLFGEPTPEQMAIVADKLGK